MTREASFATGQLISHAPLFFLPQHGTIHDGTPASDANHSNPAGGIWLGDKTRSNAELNFYFGSISSKATGRADAVAPWRDSFPAHAATRLRAWRRVSKGLSRNFGKLPISRIEPYKLRTLHLRQRIPKRL